MHSIQVPSDVDLQQYPHIFFSLPDNWDTSVLDHGTTPALLDVIQFWTFNLYSLSSRCSI